MPRFGICTSVDNALIARDAGWDFIEGNVQQILMGDKDDATWAASGWKEKIAGAALPMPAANCLVPGNLKITGPEVNAAALKAYMTNVLKRADAIDMRTLVFGSGGARNVPEGFERAKAVEQILDFVRMAVPIAQQYNVTIVAEHLNKKECNIINSVQEAMEYVSAVNHPNFRCLVDSWHLWLENEPLGNLESAMPAIRHVHLADKEGRVAPGQAGSDYRAFFGVLKRAGYDGRISVEAKFVPDLASTAKDVLARVKQQWAEA